MSMQREFSPSSKSRIQQYLPLSDSFTADFTVNTRSPQLYLHIRVGGGGGGGNSYISHSKSVGHNEDSNSCQHSLALTNS